MSPTIVTICYREAPPILPGASPALKIEQGFLSASTKLFLDVATSSRQAPPVQSRSKSSQVQQAVIRMFSLGSCLEHALQLCQRYLESKEFCLSGGIKR